jgi:hypothetical protein
MHIGVDFIGLKQPVRNAEHSPPSIAKVKNGGAIPPISRISSWHSAELIKIGNNFTFMLYSVEWGIAKDVEEIGAAYFKGQSGFSLRQSVSEPRFDPGSPKYEAEILTT